MQFLKNRKFWGQEFWKDFWENGADCYATNYSIFATYFYLKIIVL